MPPILVNDYTWSETQETVDITLPLRDVSHKNVDILSTKKYIKVNFAPFLCEIFLFESCDEEKSRAVFNGNRIHFHLAKENQIIWNRLTTTEKDKRVLQAWRNEAIDHFRNSLKDEQKNRIDLKSKQGRFAIEQQIKLDQEEKDKIKATRELEKCRALAESKPKKLQVVTPVPPPKAKVKKEPPPIRKGGTISVNFTAREFTTAARESTKAQEDEWLKTKAESLKKLEEAGPKLPVDVILSKSESLMSEKDWTSCSDFLSKSLRHYPGQAELYLARSKCNLELENLEASLQDASKALDFMKYSSSNDNDNKRSDFIAAYSLRARALEKLEMHVEALIEWKAASDLSNDSLEITEKMRQLKMIIEGKI